MYSKAIKRIQNNAMNPRANNSVSFVLTDQQALSIYLRARQLMGDGNPFIGYIDPEEKERQIEVCYKQREQQFSN